jgi:hypothetical protein
MFVWCSVDQQGNPQWVFSPGDKRFYKTVKEALDDYGNHLCEIQKAIKDENTFKAFCETLAAEIRLFKLTVVLEDDPDAS